MHIRFPVCQAPLKSIKNSYNHQWLPPFPGTLSPASSSWPYFISRFSSNSDAPHSTARPILDTTRSYIVVDLNRNGLSIEARVPQRVRRAFFLPQARTRPQNHVSCCTSGCATIVCLLPSPSWQPPSFFLVHLQPLIPTFIVKKNYVVLQGLMTIPKKVFSMPHGRGDQPASLA